MSFSKILVPENCHDKYTNLTYHIYDVNGCLKGGAGHILHSCRQHQGFNVSPPVGVDSTLSKQVLPRFCCCLGGRRWDILPGSGWRIWMAPQCGHTGKRCSHAFPLQWGYIVVLTVKVAWSRRHSACNKSKGLELCSSCVTVWLNIIPALTSLLYLFKIFSIIWAIYLLLLLQKSAHSVYSK